MAYHVLSEKAVLKFLFVDNNIVTTSSLDQNFCTKFDANWLEKFTGVQSLAFVEAQVVRQSFSKLKITVRIPCIILEHFLPIS